MTTNGHRSRHTWRTPAPRVGAPGNIVLTSKYEPTPILDDYEPVILADEYRMSDRELERKARVLEIRTAIDEHSTEWAKRVRAITTRQAKVTDIRTDIAAHEENLALLRTDFVLIAEGSNQKARDADALKLQSESEEYQRVQDALSGSRRQLETEQIEIEHERAMLSLHKARISAYTAEYGVVEEL